MGRRLDGLITAIREEKGPFFMARLCLRLSFSLNPGEAADSPERERELILACRALGYEPNIAERGRDSK